jgi:hypothetical protein
MAGDPLVLGWRDSIRDGLLLGPTLFTTGPQIKPEPHPLVDFVVGLADSADAAGLVAEQVTAGYDLIKVWGSHERGTLAAVIRAADSLGVPVTGHLSDLAGLEDAVTLGQSSIAHIEELVNKFFHRDLDETRIPLAVQEAQRGDLAVITTIATYDMIVRAAFAPNDEEFLQREGYDLLDPVRQLGWKSPYNGYRSASFRERRAYYADAVVFEQRIAQALHEGSVMLLAGTDAGMLPGLVPGLEIHHELALLVESGLTPYEALETATRNPGVYLGGEKPFGRIVAGAPADLVLLESNPLLDITATRDIDAVVVHGHLLDRATLDSLVDDVRRRNARTALVVERALGDGISAAAAYADSVFTATGRPAFSLTPAVILAATLAGAERVDDALALLDLTVRTYPDAYLPQFVLGQLRLLAGDGNGAARAFRRVLELEPTHAMARRRLAAAEDIANR